MKKLLGLILVLVMLVSVFAALPASAEESEGGKWNVLLNEGINLNYYEGGVKLGSVKVAAKEMGVDQTIAGKSTSVADYANGILGLGTTTELTKKLVTAMLNYGAAAQNYFGFDTDNLVGNPETNTTALKAEKAPAVCVTGNESGIYLGTSLVLTGTMQLRFYFEGNDVEVLYDNNKQFTINKGNSCYFDVPIMPYAICEPVTVSVGTTTVTYSPINYLQSMADNSALSEMVASIYAYGVAAKDYYVNEGCSHDVIVIDVVRPATMFNEGQQNNDCASCGKTISTDTIEKTDANVILGSEPTGEDGDRIFKEEYRYSIDDLATNAGGFCPSYEHPNGQSLYVEYSLLLNESFDNSNEPNWIDTPYFTNDKDRYNASNNAIFLHSDDRDCCMLGSFDIPGSSEDVGAPGVTYYPNDVVVIKYDTKHEKYCYVLDDVYGWHRFGYEFTQTAAINDEGDDVVYTFAVTVYVDGVRVLTVDLTDKWKTENLLYHATVEGNTLKYSDTKAGRYIYAFTPNTVIPKTDEEVYIPVADVYVTAGDGFVVKVEKLDTPIEEELELATNNTIDTKRYFEAVENSAECNHGGIVLEPITVPTLFSDGEGSGNCPTCGKYVKDTLPATKAELNIITTTNAANTIYETASIGEALGDKTFAPGNDLFLEFSVLLNDTIKKYNRSNGQWFDFGGIASEANVTSDKKINNKFSWFFFSDDACAPEGGFEFSTAESFTYGPDFDEVRTYEEYDETNKEDFVIIDGFDGWHRIGLQYHQNCYPQNDGSFTYDVTISVYVDGVKVSENLMDWGDMFYSVDEVDENGTPVSYKQNEDIASYFAVYYRLGNAAVISSGNTSYLPIADCHLTVGDGFVLNVNPVSNPKAESFTQGGVTFSGGKQYYKVNCVGEHDWAESIDVKATCSAPGSKSLRCTVCNAVKPGSAVEIPANGEHVLSDSKATIVTYPTIFSEGTMSGTCEACGQLASEVIPMTKAEPNIITTTNATNTIYETASIGEALGDKTFAPGNDLFLEFSILLNDTIKKNNLSNGQWFDFGGIASQADVTSDKKINNKFSWFFFSDDACAPEGGFEFSTAKSFTYGPDFDEVRTYEEYDGANKEDFVIIDGFDGWHRIGLQYHQNCYPQNDGSFTYDVTISVYVDGVKVSENLMDWGDMFYSVDEVDENGTPVSYKQNEDIASYFAVYYRLGNAAVKSSGNTSYLPIADCHLSVGDDFLIPVEKLADPIRGSYAPEDCARIDAHIYFKPLNGVMDDSCTHPDVEFSTTEKVATMFSDGAKTGECPVCHETIRITLRKTEITTEISGSTSKDPYYYQYCYLKDLTDDNNTFHSDGNALIIEYSLLINESFDVDKTNNGKAWFTLGRIGRNDNKNLNYMCWLHTDDNDSASPYVGGVEPNGTVTKFYENNGIVEKVGNYYAIKEELYYGWHRIGVKLYQTHEGAGSNAKYTMLAKIYIDGEEIMDITYGSWLSDNLLYTVDEDGVCHDNKNARTEVCSLIAEHQVPTDSSEKVYIPVADGYITCGSDFVVKVEKLDTPDKGTYSPESGVEYDADVHFTVTN